MTELGLRCFKMDRKLRLHGTPAPSSASKWCLPILFNSEIEGAVFYTYYIFK